jgi:3-oxoacyl-[acyl-carrier protein] reductase
MEGLKGKVALVAGASGGIGGAVALRLAAEGAMVHAGFRSGKGEADALVEKIRSSGGEAWALALDLADPEAPEAAVERVRAESGRLDILVNCAAMNAEAPFPAMRDEAWAGVLEANLTGAFRLCRAASRPMLLQRRGRIVNVSSVVSSRGGRGQASYAASKGGLESMTRVLALELGRKGVLANCIAPGVIETRMSERVRQEHSGVLLESIALRRFGLPGEVASLAAFLAGDEAAYITGQVIRVDGGFCL